MKISNNILTYQNVSPRFKSASGFYKMHDNKEMGYYTWFFREDLPWKDFIDYEINHFKDKDKVNIIQFGASDGSEAYSQIIGLLEHPNNENVEKFFPIEAYDIKESLVRSANSGFINMHQSDSGNLRPFDINVISRYARDVKKYFSELEQPPFCVNVLSKLYSKTYSVNPDLKKRVNFNLADMFEKLPTLQDDSNTVILCRNCLGYFDISVIQDFIKKAAAVLKSGSLFAIGDVEGSISSIDAIFQKNSFKEVLRNVYQRL